MTSRLGWRVDYSQFNIYVGGGLGLVVGLDMDLKFAGC